MKQDGCLGFLVLLNNSCKRGTPLVTLVFSPTPAKWKVLRVNCVDTSPIL